MDADAVAEVRDTLRVLSCHPHDHGWHPWYEALGAVMDREGRDGGDGPLSRAVRAVHCARPQLSSAHLTTLLCMAVKSTYDARWGSSVILDAQIDFDARVTHLAARVAEHERPILDVLLARQNAFSSARRFLVPQALIPRFAARNGAAVRLLDLGTGVGAMPRQLNSRACYQRFAPDLGWVDWQPGFRETPFECRWGVDLPPVGDLDWVRACHGPSGYYDARFEELAWSMAQPDVAGARLETRALDVLDAGQLGPFLARMNFNVVTCSFVLYQYTEAVRRRIVDTVVTNLPAPGMFLSMEPNGDLGLPGCSVRIRLAGVAAALEFATVSSGHFIGEVRPGSDFAEVLRSHIDK